MPVPFLTMGHYLLVGPSPRHGHRSLPHLGWWGGRMGCWWVGCIAHGPSPFPSTRVGCLWGMGGIEGHVRGAYGAYKFSQNSGVAPTLKYWLQRGRKLHHMWWLRPFLMIKLVIGRLWNAKGVVGLLRNNHVRRWGHNLSKFRGYFRTVESATMALGLPLRLDKRFSKN